MQQQNKLNILAIIPSGFCYGLQHVTIGIFAQIKDRTQVHFLVSKWSNGDFEKLLIKEGFAYSYSWLGMFSRKLDWVNLKMSLEALIKLPSLYYKFYKLCRKLQPDILFFANHHELILLLPVLWLTKKKVVCHIHDPAPAIDFQKKTFAWYGKRVNHFITISEDVKNRLMLLGCAASKITVVHNGIHLPEASLIKKRSSRFIEQFTWNEDNFVVGITGQMTETKGHEDLLEAFEIASKQASNLRLVIGGKAMEPLYTKLIGLIAAKGLQEKVCFSGWYEHVSDFYAGIDVFVLASRHDEGYGLVVAEAMSYQKPVIITASGGAVEIVNDSCGFIISKSETLALCEKILMLAKNTDLYIAMGKAARKRVEEYFDICKRANEFADIMNNI